MADHEYTSGQALELIMDSIRSASADLADTIQGLIDSGIDIIETEHATGTSRKQMSFRRRIALTSEEALKVVVEALQAYFVEQSLFSNATLNDFQMTAIGDSLSYDTYPPSDHVRGVNEPKEVVFDLGTETEIAPSFDRVHILRAVSDSDIETQQANLDRVLALVDFS